ncbi:hypothetical protein HWV62_19535 [Athelia sp. TMB]|nr:hypothetical protein HWV62_19535 [Athelia sp. TMB]
MAPVRNARVLYLAHPTTYIQPGETTRYDDSQTIDIENVPLNGGFLLQSIVISSDPYIRTRLHAPEVKGYLPPMIIGQPMEGFGIGRVVRSEEPKYPKGTVLYGMLGMCNPEPLAFDDAEQEIGFEEYAVRNDKDVILPWMPMQKADDLSWSLYVGTLGVPGQTAYFGWRALAEEKGKTAKTLFISVAGGPVGSFLIQFVKMKHPHIKIIASAGTQQKLDQMKALGADVVINYKTEDVAAILEEHGPLDIYWDMAAGPILDAALAQMNKFGLIVNFDQMFKMSLTVRGFHAYDFLQEYMEEFLEGVPKLVKSGKIMVSEQRFVGLENAEAALLAVHTGTNFGKAVVVVSDDA